MAAEKVLALDIGTSSTKAVLFDCSGAVQAESEAKHAIINQRPGQQEQDARHWWQSTRTAVHDLDDLSGIAAIVLSGTMQNVIPVDRDGQPLRSAILYGDSRGAPQFAALAPAIAAARMACVIGNAPNAFMAAFKMRWLLENERDVFEHSTVLHSGAKDYVIHCLTGRHVTDPTAATTVGLMDLSHRRWDRELLRAFGIPEGKLPVIVSSRAIVGRVTAHAADQLGLMAGIAVINGMGDAGATALGAGLTQAGGSYIYLGTTAWVARVTAAVDITLPAQTFALAHPDPDKIIEVAPILSGGDCVEWLLATVGLDLGNLGERAAAVDASPPDLLFLPYLKGERSPFVDMAVRGGFLMVDRSHGPAEMLYAVMEGIALLLRENLEALDVKADTIRLLGGGGVSEIWPQLIADAVGKRVAVANEPRTATAFGAFCEAAQALGWSPDVNRFGMQVVPRAERSARTELRRRLFRVATDFAQTLPNR